MEQRSTRSLYYLCLFVGAIGAAGQAFLLRHDLVDCYPYKVMSYEAYAVYTAIAGTGIWTAVPLSVLLALFLARNKAWLAVLIPVVALPLIFALVFKIYSEIYFAGLETGVGEFTVPAAAGQFYSSCVSLLITGSIVGSIFSATVHAIARRLSNEISLP